MIGGRAIGVDILGVKATIGATGQQQKIAGNESPASLPALSPPAPAPVAVRPAAQLIEDKIRTELVPYAPANREPALIGALAIARLNGQHEFHYNRIFGSQITGLKQLDENGPAAVDQARTFFEPYTTQYPKIDATYGFDGWLGFMVSAGLVERDGEKLKATPFGHDFLVYLREQRLTEGNAG